jgi:hypothetical protein
MTVRQGKSGAWEVINKAGTILATLPTNEDAWRWIDRQSREYDWSFMNKSE